MNSPAPERGEVCPNCGEQTLQVYCSRCGEKRVERDEWKLRNVFAEVFSEVTDVENSKLWQTLRLLLFKPGQLTRDHWAGKRRSYLGPVKLYLIFFALSVVLYSMHQPTAVYDVRGMMAADRTGFFTARVEEVANATGMSLGQAAEAVNARWHNYLSASQLVYPLLLALALKLLYLRRGRYFAEHLIFSLHVLAFTTFSFLVVWPLYFGAGFTQEHPVGWGSPVNWVITGASVIWLGVYLLFALRRAYADGWPPAFARAVVVQVVYFAGTMAVTYGTLLAAINAAGGGS